MMAEDEAMGILALAIQAGVLGDWRSATVQLAAAAPTFGDGFVVACGLANVVVSAAGPRSGRLVATSVERVDGQPIMGRRSEDLAAAAAFIAAVGNRDGEGSLAVWRQLVQEEGGSAGAAPASALLTTLLCLAVGAARVVGPGARN
jgi:hypothetical protein